MEQELVAVIKGNIDDFQKKMDVVEKDLNNTTKLVDKYGNTATQSGAKVNKAFSDNAKTITANEKSWTYLGSTLGKYVLGFASVTAAIKIGEGLINSSSAASDKWEKAIGGLTFGMQQLGRQIVNLELENLISNFEKAIDKGEELTERLDDLQDSTRSLSIVQSELGSEIAKLRELASYEDTPLKDRINYIKKAITLQTELNQKILDNATQARDISADRLTAETGLTKEQADNFLKQYNNQKDLREQALKLIADYNSWVEIAGKSAAELRLQKALGEGFGVYDKQGNYYLYKTTQLVASYREQLLKYGLAADTSIDDYVRTTVNLNQAVSQGSQSLRGLNRQLNALTPNQPKEKTAQDIPTLLKPIDKASVSNVVDITANLDDLNKSMPKTIEFWEQFSDTVSTRTTVVFDKFGNKLGEMKQTVIDVNAEIESLIEQGVYGLADAIGRAIGGGGDFGLDSILIMFADWAQKLGGILIAAGIAIEGFKKQALSNPYGVVILGAALVAAGAAVKAAVENNPTLKSSSSSSGGGGARFDIEGQRLLRGAELKIEVNGVITGKGKDLQVVLDKETKRRNL